MSKYNLYLASLLGCALGDALGVPVEGKVRGRFCITEMIGNEIYPPGTWSDDTALTLCLAETLLECGLGEGSETVLMQKCSDWLNRNYMSATGVSFGIGGTTWRAIHRFDTGIQAGNCGGREDNTNGNGSLMRISPLAYFLNGEASFEARIYQVERFSKVTHAHPRSVLGCIIYVEFLVHLYRGDSLANSLDAALAEICEKLAAHKTYSSEFLAFGRIVDKSILTAEEKNVKTSCYVVDSLEAVLWCLFTTNTFQDCVLKAVNLGDDSDTTGAIAGAAAGILYGIDAIPLQWLSVLARKNDIVKLSNEKED